MPRSCQPCNRMPSVVALGLGIAALLAISAFVLHAFVQRLSYSFNQTYQPPSIKGNLYEGEFSQSIVGMIVEGVRDDVILQELQMNPKRVLEYVPPYGNAINACLSSDRPELAAQVLNLSNLSHEEFGISIRTDPNFFSWHGPVLLDMDRAELMPWHMALLRNRIEWLSVFLRLVNPSSREKIVESLIEFGRDHPDDQVRLRVDRLLEVH